MNKRHNNRNNYFLLKLFAEITHNNFPFIVCNKKSTIKIIPVYLQTWTVKTNVIFNF